TRPPTGALTTVSRAGGTETSAGASRTTRLSTSSGRTHSTPRRSSSDAPNVIKAYGWAWPPPEYAYRPTSIAKRPESTAARTNRAESFMARLQRIGSRPRPLGRAALGERVRPLWPCAPLRLGAADRSARSHLARRRSFPSRDAGRRFPPAAPQGP